MAALLSIQIPYEALWHQTANITERSDLVAARVVCLNALDEIEQKISSIFIVVINSVLL
jgi:hypothetical protein